MVRLSVLSVAWAAGLALTSSSPAPLVGVRTRNLPGTSDEDTMHLLLRRLAEVAHEKRQTVFKNNATLEGSWNEAILFSQEIPINSTVEELEAAVSIEVKCSTCYFKAGASAELNITGSFDFGNATRNITTQIGRELKNLTDTSAAAIKTIADQVWDEVEDLIDFDLSTKFSFEEAFSFDNVSIDTDIDIDLPPLPEVQLLFQIDYLDLYVAIDTTIAAEATLTLPLFTSPVTTPFGPLGITISPDLEIGIFVTIDLILSVEGEISLRSGFHLLVEDPIGFKIAMFGSDVSDVIFNGGKFEFLPVTILSGEVALKGILRVGMHAGFDISSKKLLVGNPFDQTKWTVTAGVEVGVFAHVAEFLTNITGGAEQIADTGCAVNVVQEYTLALGAVAGATLAVANHTWGGAPETTVPIFYTTLADVCAATAEAKTTPPSSASSSSSLLPTSTGTGGKVGARQAPADLTTTTISTKALFTATSCLSPGLILCPQSLQTTSVQTKTLTLVTAVPSGVKATFPPTTAPTVGSTIPFGKAANTLAATSGSPVSFVPPPPPPTTSPSASASGREGIGGVVDDIGEVFNGQTNGVSNKLIIGLSVGLGVPFVAAVISGLVYCLRRKRYAPVPKSDKNMTAVEYTGGLGGGSGAYDSPMAAEREAMLKKGPAVTITVQQ